MANDNPGPCFDDTATVGAFHPHRTILAPGRQGHLITTERRRARSGSTCGVDGSWEPVSRCIIVVVPGTTRCRDLFESAGSAGLVAIRDGEVVLAFGEDPPVPVQSVTKLVVALGVGNALESLGSPIELARRPLRELLPGPDVHAVGDVTLEGLLRHRSGLRPIPPRELEQAEDPTALALASARITSEPPQFAYNNAGMFVVAQVMEQLTGRRLEDWLVDTVFAPLGCEVGWLRDRTGRAMPHGGLVATALTLARVGDAARRGSIVNEDWVNHLVAVGASAYPQPGWVEQRITAPVIDRWREAGIAPDLIAAVGPISDGTTIGALMRQAPGEALSALGAAIAGAGLRIADSEVGPVVGWGHDGDGGQWLIVSPENQLAMAHTRQEMSYDKDPQFFPPQAVLDELSAV